MREYGQFLVETADRRWSDRCFQCQQLCNLRDFRDTKTLNVSHRLA